ncbi:MAG TPA: hypothetical protein DDW84_06465 [Phycisphaerales bacterium]|nr:MAG: hypothetical protein A2Y13_01700 [Planctomycetes bacterium GWC2_45_44]HBG78470.1 hypothetical protein [Phycisphaerales bacterium]HBR19973.1 hypothetical protein [Phycisphaerales bacterium]
MKKYGLFTLVALPTIIMYALSSANAEPNELMIYEVNKNVSDFGDNDFSTPEAAYAAINRIVALNDAQKLAAVSLTRLSEGVIKAQISDNPLSPEWKKTLENAQILEVWVWKDKYAAVIAELPQKFSDTPIEKPIDLRGLNPENGKWLNHEDGRVRTVEEARTLLSEDLSSTNEKVKKLHNRISSAKRLSELGKTLIVFANDNNEKYPESLQDLSKVDVNAEDLAWLMKNIEYIGHKVRQTDLPNAVIAYDKALFEEENSEGTNVLYNDLHVSFEKNNSLEKLGINTRSTGFDKLTTGISGQAEIKNDFKATLSNGVTVELIGVCEHPSKGKQWWGPDGEPLGYEIETIERSSYQSKDPGYEFVFKTPIGFDQIKIEIKDSTTCSDIEVLKPSGLFAGQRAHIKAGTKATDIKIGVVPDKADWNTIAEHNGQGTTFRNVDGGKVIFSQANDSPDGLLITITDDLNDKKADRVIVIDKSGKENRAHLQTSLTVNGMRQQTFVAKEVKAENATSYKFQQMSYKWTTLKNVSLKPNVKTDVQIGVEKDTSEESALNTRCNVSFRRDMSIRDALRFLGEKYKKNIIPSDKINGKLAVRELYDVTFEEILKAVIGTNKYIIDGNFIRVYTAEEYKNLQPNVKTDVQIGTVEDSRKLLMERRDILQKTLHDVEMSYNAGRADSKQIGQVKIDLLRVEIELSETPQKRIDLLSQIVTIYAEQEKSTKLLLDAGRTTRGELDRVKLQRLNAEEELAKATAETKKI